MSDLAAFDSAAEVVLDELVDDAILGLAFEIHRYVKTGLYELMDPYFGEDGDRTIATESSSAGGMVDVFGQAITTTSGVPALKKQCECICPNCRRNLAASRFAPHLEKCMGMGRNSSRIASRRLANTNKDAQAGAYQEDGGGGDDEDEDWIEPGKAIPSNRRKRDKNSPRRHRGCGSRGGGSFHSSSSNSNDYDTHSGVQTPPLGYESMTLEERSNVLANICGVISSNSRKICMRTTKCPSHTDAQRREIRIRWLSNEEEAHVDIDSFTDGDTATLRESLAQLSNASSPAESTISTSSNPSANSSVRGTNCRREKGRKGKRAKGGSKCGSRGSTPPLPMAE